MKRPKISKAQLVNQSTFCSYEEQSTTPMKFDESLLIENSIKIQYPKLFNLRRFRTHMAFYIAFLEYLESELSEKNTDSLRKSTQKFRKLFEKRNFTYAEFHSAFKSHLHAYYKHLIFEYDFGSSAIQKLTQKILQDLHQRCPILKYDRKIDKFRVDKELLHKLHKDFLICESAILD